MTQGYPSGVSKGPQSGIICSRRIQPISSGKKVTTSSILLEVASKGCPYLQSPGGLSGDQKCLSRSSWCLPYRPHPEPESVRGALITGPQRPGRCCFVCPQASCSFQTGLSTEGSESNPMQSSLLLPQRSQDISMTSSHRAIHILKRILGLV